jgi:hypothetical protein
VHCTQTAGSANVNMMKPYKYLMAETGDKMSLGDLIIDDRIIFKCVLKL